MGHALRAVAAHGQGAGHGLALQVVAEAGERRALGLGLGLVGHDMLPRVRRGAVLGSITAAAA